MHSKLCDAWTLLLAILICISRSLQSDVIVEQGEILLATHKDIRRIDLETYNTSIITGGLSRGTAIDYDYEKRIVVWSDVENKGIFSINLDTGDKKDIVKEVMKVDGLAVDWIHGYIYWTDTTSDVLSVVSLDGSMRKLLFDTGLDEPRAVALNPSEGWMFWTDWGRNSKIERAGMDGTHRSTIVTNNVRWPNGLTIDYDTKKLYWNDGSIEILCSSDYDGSNIKIILQNERKLEHPFGLDVFKDWLYWTDWDTDLMYRVDKSTGQNLQNVAGSFTHTPMGIKVFHSDKQRKGTNYCNEASECSHFCFAAPRISEDSPKFTCACPSGMLLDENQRNCSGPTPPPVPTFNSSHAEILMVTHNYIRKIDLDAIEKTTELATGLDGASAIDYHFEKRLMIWTDVSVDFIYSSSMDEVDAKVIARTEIRTPDGLAVDWIHDLVYWTDTGTDTISVIRIDGSMRKTLFSSGLAEPRAIVVNPLEGWMFWTDWGNSPKIERAGMDGTQRSVIISTNLGWPNGLSIDFDSRKIYWADAQLDTISGSDYDGSDVKIILSSSNHLKHPFGMDVFEGWLYWTDWTTESLNKADRFTGGNIQIVQRGVSKPMGIKVLHESKQPAGENLCEEAECSHLCLPAPELTSGSVTVTSECSCPNGMSLDENQRNCSTIVTTTVASTVQDCPYDPAFNCSNGKCTKMAWACDGDNDCGDNSDEENCAPSTTPMPTTRGTCSSDKFTCDNGKCIRRHWVCDRDNDCGDNSDEKNCHTTTVPPPVVAETTLGTCPYSEAFSCANGRCVRRHWVCDGDNDCRDNSDEQNCDRAMTTQTYQITTLPPARCPYDPFFVCAAGGCIKREWVCDGDNDCPDNSDEQNCDKDRHKTDEEQYELITYVEVNTQDEQQTSHRMDKAAEQKGSASASKTAGIIFGILIALTALSVVAFFIYKHHFRRNSALTNFDNPVYQKQFEDSTSLESNTTKESVIIRI